MIQNIINLRFRNGVKSLSIGVCYLNLGYIEKVLFYIIRVTYRDNVLEDKF
jgi:hypothetical protein